MVYLCKRMQKGVTICAQTFQSQGHPGSLKLFSLFNLKIGEEMFFPVETRDVKIINHFSKCSELSAKECKNQGPYRSEPSLSFQIRGILTTSVPLLNLQIRRGELKPRQPTTALQMKLDDSRVSKNKRYLRRKYSELMHCSQTHKFHAPTLFIRQDFSIC